ncbi:branched-chain amino acid ABC transporter permease [Acuticoccus sp. MNP-M23]|uniref:branched-chain amino acid ABC transporter permease n=1 Tax=Acuticoccus sp. MNP-M23 TaxID=3072793 RepID=UPI002815BD01|nr:branched-chain amino acid ABC transporter permease [Acuticoccus sp. MNP-M23]WMS43829.1 branched-chain amino acid ABC transporter permease [Acuticoccus sp. MNP-M23]
MEPLPFNEALYWTFIDIANALLTGTMIGGYYAMLAFGLALSFGVMRLVNLAHGEFLVVGAYLSSVILQVVPVPPFLVLIVVVPIMFCIGYGLQRFLLNRVSVQAMERRGMSANFGLMAPILVTFGLGIFISHLLLAIFASDAMSIKNGLAFSAIRLTQDLSISTLRLIFFFVAIATLIVLTLFLKRTLTGRAIRAAADDPEYAALMGIRTDHIFAVALGISLAISGLAGFMIGMTRTFQPFDGPQFILIAFGVVIIGGLNSLPGSLIGGILLGVTQVLAGTYFGPSAQLVGGYMLVLGVLAFFREGLFSK